MDSSNQLKTATEEYIYMWSEAGCSYFLGKYQIVLIKNMLCPQKSKYLIYIEAQPGKVKKYCRPGGLPETKIFSYA